jgi:hypothetical protein
MRLLTSNAERTMPKSRKTVNVEELRLYANEMLKADHGNAPWRNGVILMIERVLHDSGNYRGFNYLFSVDCPDGVRPGIRNIPDTTHGVPEDYEERFKDTDCTRRFYY